MYHSKDEHEYGRVLHYVLDDAGRAVPEQDALAWGRWLETSGATRTVAVTQIGPSSVTTYFLGIDYSCGQGPPHLWETQVRGGPADFMTVRYVSVDEARAGHELVCAFVRYRSTVRGRVLDWFQDAADWLYGRPAKRRRL